MKLEKFKIPIEVLPDSWVDRWKCLDQTNLGVSISTQQNEIFRSDIGLCLYVKLSPELPEVVNNDLKELVRDQALELADWSNYQGHSLPLFCLIQCSKKMSVEWRRIAGDQEWLRGQLSLQIVESDEEVEKRLDLLLNDSFPDIDEVKPLSDKALATKLMDILNDDENKYSTTQREFLKTMVQGFDSSYALNGLNKWEKGLVEDYQNILGGNDVKD